MISNIPKNKSSNAQQAFWIALGSLFSFSFGIASSMILSRYLPKEDYGTFRQVIYVYNTLLTIFTLGIPKAYSYFLPRVNINQAKNLIRKITNLLFLLGGIFSILLFSFSGQIADFLRNPALAYTLKIFSIVPLLMMPTMGLEGILSTFRMTKFMAFYTVITRILMLICVILPVVLFNGGYIQAILGFVIGSVFSFGLALYLKYRPIRKIEKEITTILYKDIFKFSLPLLYASLWGVLISSADQFFISRYFGSSVFAEFSNGAIKLPFIGMIVGATSSVLSPIFSKMQHQNSDPEKEMLPLWRSAFEKSAILIYPLVIYTIFFAKPLMIFLYGEIYVNSAVYFRILNLINFLDIIVYGPLLINIGKVSFYARVHMVTAFLVIAMEFVSVHIFPSPYLISIISLICQLFKIGLLLWGTAKFFRISIIRLFPVKLIVQILLPSILILSIEFYLFRFYWIMPPFPELVITFGLYTLVFFIYARKAGIGYISLLHPFLNKIKV